MYYPILGRVLQTSSIIALTLAQEYYVFNRIGRNKMHGSKTPTESRYNDYDDYKLLLKCRY